jgi:hypothetical protein
MQECCWLMVGVSESVNSFAALRYVVLCVKGVLLM